MTAVGYQTIGNNEFEPSWMIQYDTVVCLLFCAGEKRLNHNQATTLQPHSSALLWASGLRSWGHDGILYHQTGTDSRQSLVSWFSNVTSFFRSKIGPWEIRRLFSYTWIIFCLVSSGLVYNVNSRFCWLIVGLRGYSQKQWWSTTIYNTTKTGNWCVINFGSALHF